MTSRRDLDVTHRQLGSATSWQNKSSKNMPSKFSLSSTKTNGMVYTPQTTSTRQSASKPSPKQTPRADMSGVLSVAVEAEDLMRPPESSSDSEEEDAKRADIVPNTFGTRTTAAELPIKGKADPKRDARASTAKSLRGSQVSLSSSSQTSNGSSSPKRKSPPGSILGGGMKDAFGRVQMKKSKSTYGSSQKSGSQRSSQPVPRSSQPSSSAGYGKKVNRDKEAKDFVVPPQPLDFSSDEDDQLGFQMPKGISLSATASTKKNKINGGFKSATLDPSVFESPVKKEFTKNAGFKSDALDQTLFDSPPKPECNESSFMLPSWAISLDSPTKSAPSETPPMTQYPQFKTPDLSEHLSEGLASTIREELKTRRVQVQPVNPDDDAPRCPMCNQKVSAESLKQLGRSNVRQQEAFCRSHQKSEAEEKRQNEGYPEIDWDALGARLQKHHAFIKELIEGKDCHYRQVLEVAVREGKDRSAMKQTSNLTPGYYGPRGLRVITENIMHEFTPLLKLRNVTDRLMVARGSAGFVQAVLVPEVTVRLIMEDMSKNEEEARSILADSVVVGELLQEEIKDEVLRIDDIDEE